MTQNTVPLPEPLCRDDTEHGVNYYTADQMHAHAAKVCAEKDAEIERLRADAARMTGLEEAAGISLEVLVKHRQMKGDAPMGMLGHRAIEAIEKVFRDLRADAALKETK
jgi:hypothetical protein